MAVLDRAMEREAEEETMAERAELLAKASKPGEERWQPACLL